MRPATSSTRSGEVSREVCQRFAAMNAEALRAALESATTLHTALEANRTLPVD